MGEKSGQGTGNPTTGNESTQNKNKKETPWDLLLRPLSTGYKYTKVSESINPLICTTSQFQSGGKSLRRKCKTASIQGSQKISLMKNLKSLCYIHMSGIELQANSEPIKFDGEKSDGEK